MLNIRVNAVTVSASVVCQFKTCHTIRFTPAPHLLCIRSLAHLSVPPSPPAVPCRFSLFEMLLVQPLMRVICVDIYISIIHALNAISITEHTRRNRRNQVERRPNPSIVEPTKDGCDAHQLETHDGIRIVFLTWNIGA